jgi:hypothetical protein
MCVHVMYIKQETQNNQLLLQHDRENISTAHISVLQILCRQCDVKRIKLYKQTQNNTQFNSWVSFSWLNIIIISFYFCYCYIN